MSGRFIIPWLYLLHRCITKTKKEVFWVWHDISFHGVAPVLGIRGLEGSHSLPLPSDPFWPRLVIHFKVPSMGQIDQFKDYSYSIAIFKEKYLQIIWIKNNFWKLLLFGPVNRVFANGPGDRGSVPGRVIPKT